MKSTCINKNTVALFMAAALAVSAVAQEKKPLSTEESILTSITATVQAVDPEKREVTLKGPLGNSVTFVVDQRVKRLDEVKVGDEVTAAYYISVAGELRAPTESEQEHPVQIVEGTVRAPKGTEPAGGVLHVIKVVTTVQGLDLPTRSVTLQGQGPLGLTTTIRAKNVEKLKQLRLGDTILVTYTEALAVSLDKAPKMKE
jgi:Cu/Ag efflux protein CusF